MIITHTLGCKVNYADTQAIVRRLPHLAGSDGDGRAVAVVGTCCVTAEGEKQSRKEVRRAVRRVGPGGRVFVTGCAARLSPAAFEALADNVEVVTGDPAAVAAEIARREGVKAQTAPEAALPETRRTRFFLKVQDGCASMCAYCVVPLVRGRPRSVPLQDLLADAQARVAAGCPEIVVSGINVGAYRDPATGAGLDGLLAGLALTQGLLRLRLSSVEVSSITPDLLDAFAAHGNIAPHLHIPLQSGDDAVLAAMGRRYTTEEFLAAVRRVRQRIPDVNITTDVITGFPGEDAAAFERTLEAVAAAGFSKIHAFVYSPRPGTHAGDLGDPVSAAEKKERSARLRQLSDRLGRAYRRRKVGRPSEILWESRTAGPDGAAAISGYSADYVRFTLPEPPASVRPSTLGMALAESVTADGIMGKLVDGRKEEACREGKACHEAKA